MLAQAVYLLSLVDPSLAANTVSPGGVTLLLLIDFDLKIVSQFYFHLMFFLDKRKHQEQGIDCQPMLFFFL